MSGAVHAGDTEKGQENHVQVLESLVPEQGEGETEEILVPASGVEEEAKQDDATNPTEERAAEEPVAETDKADDEAVPVAVEVCPKICEKPCVEERGVCCPVVCPLAAGSVLDESPALSPLSRLFGCAVAPRKYWLGNRLADLMDIFAVGVGVSKTDESRPYFPPSHGVYAEALSLVNLGWIFHEGTTAEMEGRGLGVYSELRKIRGLALYKEWQINQGQEKVNYYKDAELSAAWQDRMQGSDGLAPARKLIHSDAELNHAVCGGNPRGWRNWAYIGVEAAVPDPILTQRGITVRLGVNAGEVLDFVLGMFSCDFFGDDRLDSE